MLPEDIKYTTEHVWLKIEDDRVVIGITDYAQKELGDVVFVDLPAVGERFTAGDAMITIESVKAVSEINIPISGEIMETNDDLEHSPELINQDPYRKGWIAVIEPSDPNELKGLLTAKAYSNHIGKK
ncbi:MAG TPA: glycine cleavage system protein GcvH [Bacillota bacterium]|nr:glycine cleavage system protein GcvH [Bacillota bacterium]HOL11206.1 glycine cleavage system protein GcvH [Bacillota bacterium]HPO98915.1 glycine cleavage system protein GcvH [Bacillota bacterium]